MSRFKSWFFLLPVFLFAGCASAPIESTFHANASSKKYSRILVRYLGAADLATKADAESALKKALVEGSSSYVFTDLEGASTLQPLTDDALAKRLEQERADAILQVTIQSSGPTFELLDPKTKAEIWSGSVRVDSQSGTPLDMPQLFQKLIGKMLGEKLLKEKEVVREFPSAPYW